MGSCKLTIKDEKDLAENGEVDTCWKGDGTQHLSKIMATCNS